MTTRPPFMYSNTANRSPFSDGPFIVASKCENNWTPRLKKRRLHDELVQGGYAERSPKSELCGFKWANAHNKCVHDSMQLANSSPNPCLMWLHYIWYQIKLGPKLICLDKGVARGVRGYVHNREQQSFHAI